MLHIRCFNLNATMTACTFAAQFSSVQNGILCAQKSPYALHSVSQKLPQSRIWNGLLLNVQTISKRSFSLFSNRKSWCLLHNTCVHKSKLVSTFPVSVFQGTDPKAKGYAYWISIRFISSDLRHYNSTHRVKIIKEKNRINDYVWEPNLTYCATKCVALTRHARIILLLPRAREFCLFV